MSGERDEAPEADDKTPNRPLNKDDIAVQHMPDRATDPNDRDFATTHSEPVDTSDD